jgi:uncharacterized protein
LTITRRWSVGDVVDMTLPMNVRRVVSNDKLKSNTGLVAIENGPLVYCVEGVDNSYGIASIKLFDDAALTVEHRSGLLNGVNIVKGKAMSSTGETQFIAIPYYTWSNRGIGEMKVWLPRANR